MMTTRIIEKTIAMPIFSELINAALALVKQSHNTTQITARALLLPYSSPCRHLIGLLEWSNVKVRYVQEVSSGGSGEGSQPLLQKVIDTWVPERLLICRSTDR
jgi:hypothetical protein